MQFQGKIRHKRVQKETEKTVKAKSSVKKSAESVSNTLDSFPNAGHDPNGYQDILILQESKEVGSEEDEEEDEGAVDKGEELGAAEEPADEGGGAPAKSKAKKDMPASNMNVNNVLGKQPKGEKGKVDGVGVGAVAAAALHTDFNVDTLIKDSKWKEGEPVPYAFLVAAFNEIAPQSKRLAIIATLTNTFRCAIRLTPEDLLPMVYLCTSRVCYLAPHFIYGACLLQFAPLQRCVHAHD
jgi:hypothetical protein